MKVKICGVTRPEDARAAAGAGADYVGAILSPGYGRSVAPAHAAGYLVRVGGAPDGTEGDVADRRPVLVGVLVDPSPAGAVEAGRAAGAGVLQLHGHEPPSLLRTLRDEGDWQLWKTIRVEVEDDLLRAVESYGEVVDGILVDGGRRGERGGGRGVRFPWEVVAGARDLLPPGLTFVAAGGLRPDTVGEAVRALRPDVVDVSSGVEIREGVKDPSGIRAFVRAARNAEARGGSLDRGPEEPSAPPQEPRGDAGHAGDTMSSTTSDTSPAGAAVPGRFGRFGGRYVPETLIAALDQLHRAYEEARVDPAFGEELDDLLRDYVGRPTPLYRARRLEEAAGAGPIYLKREDLNHTGAHKINNTLGQALLARRMGKKRIIAETGAGQHGVATATACALFDLDCVVYMGEEDVDRQALNVYRMELLGAEVRPVASGTRTLKDATNEAIRDWVTNVEDTHYIIGSVVGPDPFPRMVRDFQAVIGEEARASILEVEGRLPAAVVACVGGGSNAMGAFHPFVLDRDVALVGVEAAGEGLDTGRHSASLAAGVPGVLHGALSYLLQDVDGQVAPAHSVSAGLDYPGVGPEHAWLKDSGRAMYVSVTDQQALEAFHRLSELEGIIPALESAHAVAHVLEDGGRWAEKGPVLICLSGRGDKDVAHVARLEGKGSLLPGR